MKREALLGQNAWELFPEAAGGDAHRQFERALSEQTPVQFEWLFPAWNRWFEYRVYPSPDGLTIFLAEITDRKQAEENLRLHRDRLAFVLDNTGVGLWLNSLPLGELNWDNRTRELFFVPPDVEPTVELFWSRLHPDDREPTRLAVEASLRHRTLYQIDHRVINPDTGEIRWIRSAGKAIYAPDGTPIRFDGINYDISDRKQAEEALRHSEERLRVSQELSLDAFTILDSVRDETGAIADFVWTYVNPKAAEILKHPMEELVGQRLLEVLPGNELNSELFERYVRVVETGKPHDIEVPYNADGIIGWFRNMAVKLGDGVAIFFSDITERKQNELLLIEQKRLLELIATGHPLDECLAAICTSVSMLSLHTRACILLADAQRLTFPRSITPDFPPSFGQGLQDAPINDLCIGTCGEAVYCGEPVTCADIAHDDRWSQEWRDLCVAHGVLACHSAPILGLEGLSVGSLMLCFDEARMPNDWEYQLAHFGVQVASLVFERDRASLALRESEARFRGVVESNMVGILFWDTSGCITDGNEMAVQMLGYSQEELQSGQVHWIDITPPEFHEIDAAMQDQLLTQGVCSPFEKAYIRKDGTQIPILIGGALIPGYSDRGVAYFLDISDRKQAEHERERLLQQEQTLRQQAEIAERRLYALLESIREDFVLFDHDWRVVYLNRQAALTMQKSRDEILNQCFWDLFPDLVGTEFYDRLHQAKREQTPIQFEYHYATWDTWFENRVYPAHEGITILCTNITDRKQAEAEREQLLAREQAAREAAEAANRIKDEFLAVVSHELRSPLNPILGWSKLLRNRQLDEQKTDRALEVIERNAQMQAQLINDLLDVSRILRGKLSLDAKPIDLVATIQAAMETVRLAAEAKSIQINTYFEPNVGQVAGDAGRLQQVIWNLLTNAVKFTSEGGRVDIRLEQDGGDRGADSSSSPHSSHARITITDTGKGIPADFLPYVFEQFRQESSATNRRFGGLGLGLAIVRYLVELHGGTVQADSLGEGQGATFTVKLPLMPHQPITKPAPKPSEFSLNLQETSPEIR